MPPKTDAAKEQNEEESGNANELENIQGEEEELQTPEYTDTELKAIEGGWDPEYDGDDKRSAREFIDRGSFFQKIDTQNKSIKELQKQNKFLMDRASQAEETSYNKALADLKVQKKVALENDDHDAVIEIDDQIAETRDNKKNEVVAPSVAETPAESAGFAQFVENNPWYRTDTDMHDMADDIGTNYYSRNPGATEQEVFAHVTKQIKTLYKDKFVNKNRSNNVTVEGDNTTRRSNNKKSSVAKYTIKDLSSDERQIMENMITAGSIKDTAEYIDQLEKSGYDFPNRT